MPAGETMMQLWWVPSLLLPPVIGFLLVSLLWPVRGELFFKGWLALGLGTGICSVVFFGWLLVAGRPGSGVLLVELILVIGLSAVLFYRSRSKLAISSVGDLANRCKLPSLTFWLTLAGALIVFGLLTLRFPHGQWDAWMIWNLRARSVFRGGADWQQAFSPLLAWSHPDYPLLWPMSVARGWALVGREAALVPALLALTFSLATVGLLTSSIAALRGRMQGFLAGLVLLGTPFFLGQTASQYADIPVGFFFLATLALFCLYDQTETGSSGVLLLAGLMAGFAAWTKNEGLLFLVAVTVTRLVVLAWSTAWRTRLKTILPFAFGLLPVCLLLAWFKLRLAPGSELLLSASQTPGAKLMDVSRYLTVAGGFLRHFAGFAEWPAAPVFVPLFLLLGYPFFLGIKVPSQEQLGVFTAVITLGLMLAGYFFIYVVSPYELAWHLKGSLSRLWLQLWPSLLFVYFQIVRSPETDVVHPAACA